MAGVRLDELEELEFGVHDCPPLHMESDELFIPSLLDLLATGKLLTVCGWLYPGCGEESGELVELER